MKRILSVFIAAVLLSGCNDFAININGLMFASPSQNQVLMHDDLVVDATTVSLTYLPGIPQPNIELNGNNVEHCFTFGTVLATADYHCMDEFSQEGYNTLTANPFMFGPIRKFIVETEGPTINIDRTCFDDTVNCTDIDSNEPVIVQANEVFVQTSIKDLAGVDNATLNGYSPISNSSERYTFVVPTSDDYVFVSGDTNGYVTTETYKATGHEMPEMFNIRVDETMLAEIKDKLSVGLGGIVASDSMLASLQNLEGPAGVEIDINSLTMGSATINKIYITDEPGEQADLAIDMLYEPFGDYAAGNGSVENSGDVGVDVDLTLDLPWYLLFGINIPMHMYIERLEIDSAINIDVTAGAFTIELTSLNGSDPLTMIDVQASDSRVDIIGWFVGQPWLRSMILTIVQDVINRNLEEILISGEISTDDGSSFGATAQPETIKVTNDSPDNIGNMYITMSGSVETINYHNSVLPALGSYHVDDATVPLAEDTGSSLSVRVNSNIVNQGLLSAYNVGLTHLTVLNGDVYTGPGVADDLGNTGDVRTELIPTGPGQFYVFEEDMAEAWIRYRNAEMHISKKQSDGTWKQMFYVQVDFTFGVGMDVRDSVLFMTILTNPEFTVNEISNLEYTSTNFALFLNGGFIKGIVEFVIEFMLPKLVSAIYIDVSKFGISENLTTESITTVDGHLGFEMGVDK